MRWIAIISRFNWAISAVVLTLILSTFTPSQATTQKTSAISLVPNLPSSQPVGTTITWRAAVPDSLGFSSSNLVYRFSIAPADGAFRVVLDFNARDFFTWTPIEEGSYDVKVSVKDVASGITVEAVAPYAIRSRIVEGHPVVSSTTHPLVALYSAPPCRSGRMRVVFHPQRTLIWEATNWKPCQSEKSLNFYVGGMRADTGYRLQQELDTGAAIERGPVLEYRTGALPFQFPSFTVIDPVDAMTDTSTSVILQSPIMGVNGLAFPVATDFTGQVIWYYGQDPLLLGNWGYVTQPVAGGTMLLLLNDSETPGYWGQILREIDLAGNAVRETRVSRVNEQLVAKGQDTISAFSHEGLRLPNGHTVVLGFVERMLADAQGPGLVDVLGDMIIVLDENFQVAWTWNSFHHLDTKRVAPLDEKCTATTLGCPRLFLADTANDWTHANSVDYSPSDGNLLLSLRNQDWIIKIDYANGTGAGDILWRLGKDGDFTISSTDLYPWFSHQHDARYTGSRIALFDNGNTRCVQQPTGCSSRGQVWNVNEEARAVSLALNADLKAYASEWGSADELPNGNFHFMVGRLGLTSRSIEVRPDGAMTFVLQTNAWVYRSFRMTNLYSASPDYMDGLPTAPVRRCLPLLLQ